MLLFDGLFGRDSLKDDGHIPSKGSPCYSPDLIFHRQVENHQNFFIGNYNNDPNQAVEGDRKNHLYVRAKKLGRGTTAGKFKCYYTKGSLVMQPSRWINNPLKTADNEQEVMIPSTPYGNVTVGEKAFLWQPIEPNTHYCIVGQIITPTNPNPIPGDFPTFELLLNWIRNRPNICWRNLFIKNNSGKTWSTLKRIENIESKERSGYLLYKANNKVFPGTTIHVKCFPLGIDEKWVVETRAGRSHFIKVTLPANFHDFVETRATAPMATWPHGAGISIKFLLEAIDNDLDRFAESPAVLADEYDLRLPQSAALIGSCKMLFHTT